MPTLNQIFKKVNITLYQNESLDLDHYYQEPYQDDGDEIRDMDEPFETDKSRNRRYIELDSTCRKKSLFSFFMDGSRRTYKIGDIVLSGKEIFPVVVAQIRAGCTERGENGKIAAKTLKRKNLLLVSSRINDVDFENIRQRVIGTSTAKNINLEVIQYGFDKQKHIVPVNAAIAKANTEMHELEIEILKSNVESNNLKPDHMLIVDGPLQFIRQDKGRHFGDLFYNVVGVSKSFDPMLPTSAKPRRGGTQIGAELLKLEHEERTPVFLKVNSKGRKYGCWYLRIRPKNRVANPLDGIIKVEKMATDDDIEGLSTSVVDNLSQSLLNESVPTCHGLDKRWANHLYPVYLTETLIKSSFESDLVFINNFKRNFNSVK